MAVVMYHTQIQEDGLFAIPLDALQQLGAKPGDSLKIQIETVAAPVPVSPNRPAMLAILDDIEAWHEGRPFTTDGSDTDKLLREARSGAMYYDSDSE